MLEQLKNLYKRLMNSAGEQWIETNEYYFANKEKPTFDEAKYREMEEREDILIRAADRVKDAIAVLEETGMGLAS